MILTSFSFDGQSLPFLQYYLTLQPYYRTRACHNLTCFAAATFLLDTEDVVASFVVAVCLNTAFVVAAAAVVVAKLELG